MNSQYPPGAFPTQGAAPQPASAFQTIPLGSQKPPQPPNGPSLASFPNQSHSPINPLQNVPLNPPFNPPPNVPFSQPQNMPFNPPQQAPLPPNPNLRPHGPPPGQMPPHQDFRPPSGHNLPPLKQNSQQFTNGVNNSGPNIPPVRPMPQFPPEPQSHPHGGPPPGSNINQQRPPNVGPPPPQFAAPPSGQHPQPPMPGQAPQGGGLANQMQGMNLGPQRPQYPPAMPPPMGPNGQINGGDIGPPHLKQQQQSLNGPQSQRPWAGFPPMPGQVAPGAPFPGPGQVAPGATFPGPGQVTPGATFPGPHMPPPLTQQQYMNGQQQPMRGPPGAYPPPGPGQQMAPGYQPAFQAAQQPKRLDPDQMPSPIQVMQDDQQNRSGVFATNTRGLVPPLVTTNFVTQDQGNASPRFIRSTMYSVPISNDIMKQTAVPFSLVISPMARTVDQEYPPPIVNFGELGPVRCIRCKAYMCPYMQFIDSGRRFQCLFCKATTDVPQEYFQHLDHTGQRLDRFERPELVLGAYEFIATTDYCRNNVLPKPPAFIFVIDVSYNNIKSGLVHLLCAQMKDIIENLPIDQGEEKSNMKIGFITYNSSVHFYNIKGNLAAPQMLIVGDTQEMFMPLLDGFLCTPEESGPVIDLLMEQIPAMFGDTRETETILLPAITAGLEALKASECTGKLLVFHSTLPTAQAPGQLKNRDDRKLLATDKERTVLTPQNQLYNQLGQDCVQSGCSVDLFIFNNAYIDIATIGQVARLSGGEVFKYTYFQADIDGERLIQDIITDISRPIAFDGIMRVRTSTGVRPTDFYGHFFMSNTTDMELASIDCDKAVAIEIKHDDKLSEEEGVFIQAALLYTSCSGQRRLRVLNLSLKTCSQMADLYRSCDCDTLINYTAKQATYKLLEHAPKAIKDGIVQRAAQILATYRKNCASPSSAGQLILPECMKLLPVYVNCLLKSDALSGGADMTVDDRSFAMQAVMMMDIPTSVNYFYPRLIPLIDLDTTQENVEIPAPIRCTADKMNEQGVYILENGIHMFLWIGLGVNPDFVAKVFGVQSAIQVDIERFSLPELDNPLSLAVRSVVEQVRMQRHRFMRLTLVRQREKLEPVFKHFLAEDRGTDGSASYVDFLIHMHKEIRTLLS